MKEVGVHSNGESCMDAIDHYTSDTAGTAVCCPHRVGIHAVNI